MIPASHRETVWQLPPLILHPFSDAQGPSKLVESSRASMMMQGLLPNHSFSHEQLDQKLLTGRYCEIRMLYYVGKDVQRWLEQCMEFVHRDEVLVEAGLQQQSFSTLLVDDPPQRVLQKLQRWGVADYKAIFSRSLGLNALFADVPGRLLLHDDFIRNYYRFADAMFACRQSLTPFERVNSTNFQFELYASGEYSRMLEQQWAAEPQVDPLE